MAAVTLAGTPIPVAGRFRPPGDQPANFTLPGSNLGDVSFNKFTALRKALHIVPSLATPVCAQSTRVISERATVFDGTVVLVIAADLPFAKGAIAPQSNWIGRSRH